VVLERQIELLDTDYDRTVCVCSVANDTVQIVSATLCQCPLTVKHILVECIDFNDFNRNKYFVASSMEELFRIVDVRGVLDLSKKLILQQVMMLLNFSMIPHSLNSSTTVQNLPVCNPSFINCSIGLIRMIWLLTSPKLKKWFLVRPP